MFTFAELVERSKKFDTYKDYLDHYNISESTIENESSFIRRVDLHIFGDEGVFHDNYINERLEYSLSPVFIWKRIQEKINYIDDEDSGVINDRDKNITIQLKFDAYQFHREHELAELEKILDFCNWHIYKNIKYKDSKYRYIRIEPSKPENASRFIYNDCKGILYRILLNKNSEDNLKKILRNGLSPKYQYEEDNLFSDYRTYFLANTTDNKIKDDIKNITQQVSDFSKNKSKLKIIKIDLNKLKQNHNKEIECFEDPRMNMKCYWTAEFIPPSCIEDVTEEFKNIIL